MEEASESANWARACGIAGEPAARQVAAEGGQVAGHGALPPGDVDVCGQCADLHTVQMLLWDCTDASGSTTLLEVAEVCS